MSHSKTRAVRIVTLFIVTVGLALKSKLIIYSFSIFTILKANYLIIELLVKAIKSRFKPSINSSIIYTLNLIQIIICLVEILFAS